MGKRKQSWAVVEVAYEPGVRALCARPYPGHRRGCPNLNHAEGCPPWLPLLPRLIRMDRPVWAVWNRFHLSAHVRWMRGRHPGWSYRQLSCLLYWQPTARRQLDKTIKRFFAEHPDLAVVPTPEGAGANMTETMRRAGIVLEWPPRRWVYQIVLAGTPRRGVDSKYLQTPADLE